MDLQPLSFIDNVISCDPSDLGFETTVELRPVEDLVVNEMPISADIPDLYNIQGNDSSNSEVVPGLEEYKVSESTIYSPSLVNPSHQKQFTLMDSGFKVLSIYCANMANKWRPVLDSQPIQGSNMSVEIYYAQFVEWRKKLVEVDYISGEESYIEDFLYGLKRELATRFWEYEWKPDTLYGAFRRALIEEKMMKNNAGIVLEEMPLPKFIGIQGAKYVLDENVNVVLEASGPLDVKLQLDLPAESNSSMEINSRRHVIFPWIVHIVAHGENYIEVDLNTLIYSEVLMKKFSFDPGGCPLSNLKMYEQSMLIELNDRDVVDGGVYLQASLGSLGGTTMNDSSNGSAKAWLEGAALIIEVALGQNAMKKDASIMINEMPPTFRAYAMNEHLMAPYIIGVDGLRMFIFDPRINSLPPTGCATLKSSEVPGNSVALCFAKLLLCFNLDGCCLFQNGCAYSELNFDQGDCCLDTSISVLRDKVILHKLSIWIAHLGGIIVLTDHILSRNGLFDIDSVAGLHVDKASLGVGNTNIHFTAADMLNQRAPFADEYFLITLSHSCMPNIDSHAVISFILVSIAHRERLSKSLIEGSNSMLLIKCLYCWTLSWNKLPNEIRLVSRSGSRINVLTSLKANFAWDPGICATFIDIIEDNDVFKRAGNKVLGMVMISNIKDELFCQLNIWNIIPVLQMSMKEERYMQNVLIEGLLSPGSCFRHVKTYKVSLSNKGVMFSVLFYMVCCLLKTNSDRQYLGFWFGDKVPNGCPTSIFAMALFPVSCDSYLLWQCHIQKLQGQTTSDAIELPFSILFGISESMLWLGCSIFMLWLSVILAYKNAMKGTAISKMLHGIPMFVFRPP